MQRIGRLRFALDIARRADLQRDAVLNRTLPERGIVKNMVAMPDTLRAEVQRVPHGVRPLRVTRVAREGQAQLPRQVENRVEISQRDDPLRARQVHPHNAGAEIFLRQPHGFKVFRHVGRLRADAHTAQQNAAAIVREGAQRLLSPGQHGLDGVLLPQSGARMQLRCKADFVVNMSLPGKRCEHVAGNACDAGRVLHQLQGKFKPGKICIHVAAVRCFDEPCVKCVQRVHRQRSVLLLRHLPHRFRRNSAVQMQVQFNLRDLRHVHCRSLLCIFFYCNLSLRRPSTVKIRTI